MKNPLFNCLLLVFFLVANKSYGQCDFDDDTLKIGPVFSTNTTCPSNGSITVSGPSGGGGQYAYEIIDGPIIRIIQSQNTFNALPTGEYLVRVTGCNGDIADRVINVYGSYLSMSASTWSYSLKKVSGLECGATNDAVYKQSKPANPRGTAPYRIQISTSPNFSGVPYQPDNDSATFTGLNQSTTYYVRVTDACNNFITYNFLTPPSTPVVPLSVPSMAFGRGWFSGECAGKETIFLTFRDSATGADYSGANTFTNKAFWGHRERPYIRIKIEDRTTGVVYVDRNVSISGTAPYYISNESTIVGETGLTTGSGMYLYTRTSPVSTLPQLYASGVFPYSSRLRITIFFPGGDHCGAATVPAYSKSFAYDLGRQYPAQPRITSLQPNCNTGGSFLRVNFSQAWAGDTISLIKVTPSYSLLSKTTFNSGSNTYGTVAYSPLIIGETYRVVIVDTCGRTDSMDIVYSPSSAIVPPPAVSHESKANFKCPANPNDTMYNVIVHSLPSPYTIVSIRLDGETFNNYMAINNWNGTTQTVYKMNKLLPPGTYTYRVTWLNNCQTGVVEKTITIAPLGDPPSYNRELTLSPFTQSAACGRDAYKSININAFIKNINTNYRFNRLRVVSGPNPNVYPLYDIMGYRLEMPGDIIYSTQQTVADSVKINSQYSALKVNIGQEGMYTIAVDIICPDGTLVETLTRTINVTATVAAVASTPDLKYSNALMCASSGSQVKINMFVQGGKRPFIYEYKRDTAFSYQLTGNSGADSIVVISPAPDPGTVFDIRVTDGCGITSTNRVTVASFTGEFFMYSYPADCINNPFNTRVGTSWIRGAHYTWRRNGLVVAQGYNMPYVNLIGVTTDSVTVDVDLYNCYSGAASRIIVSPNPCNIIVLPVNSLTLSGNRVTPFNVQLNWKSVNEQKSIRYFELEKSFDGLRFSLLSKIRADEKPWEHSYVHNDPEAAALVYYRLRVTSIDGKETLTPILSVENNKANKTKLLISPNPARDNISLGIATDKAKPYKARMFNDKGQLVKEFSITPEEINAKKIDISLMATGSYFISLIDNWEIVASAKFIKQ